MTPRRLALTLFGAALLAGCSQVRLVGIDEKDGGGGSPGVPATSTAAGAGGGDHGSGGGDGGASSTGGGGGSTIPTSASSGSGMVPLGCQPDPLSAGQEMASGSSDPGIAVNAAEVFWIDQPGGGADAHVYGMPTTCDTVFNRDWDLGPVTVNGLFADDQNVYVALGSPAEIRQLPIGGGGPKVLATGASPFVGITADTTHVYWTIPSEGAVRVVPIDGSPAEAYGISTAESQPAAIYVGPSALFWADRTAQQIRTAPKASGIPAGFAAAAGQPSDIAQQAAGVVWLDVPSALGANDGKVMWNSGGGSQILASGLMSPEHLALDAGHVFWTDSKAGTVQALPYATGMMPVTLAKNQQRPTGIAVEQGFVYWVDSDRKLLLRIAAP